MILLHALFASVLGERWLLRNPASAVNLAIALGSRVTIQLTRYYHALLHAQEHSFCGLFARLPNIRNADVATIGTGTPASLY